MTANDNAQDPIFNPEFDEMHRQMQAIIDRHDHDKSWESPEVELCARQVLFMLAACARNEKPLGVLQTMLGEYTAALDKAKNK